MKNVVLLVVTTIALSLGTQGPRASGLGTPGFHHLHLNSVDPDAAIAFYTAEFPSTRRTKFEGMPALESGKVLILFNKVSTPPPIQPASAFWHFGWHVVSSHADAQLYRQRHLTLFPLYTSDAGETVTLNSDSWPGNLTRSEIAVARSKGIKPTHDGGWAYLRGPDNAIVEYQGDFPFERFNHIHMWQEDPYCAEMWYDTHLNAKESASWPRSANLRPQTSEACRVSRGEPTWPSLDRMGTVRAPAGGVTFDDVELNWYPRQGSVPLVSPRGQLMDHIALSVSDLDAWSQKLRAEGVTILKPPYALGRTRAVMIEGPSREAIEIVEVKR